MRTLLIAGVGDVARRALPALTRRWRVLALVRSPEAAHRARSFGAIPLPADLDDDASLERAAGLADAVLYTAPPPLSGATDPRMRKLLSALGKGESIPQRWVYISTTGVYGDAGGAWLHEASPCRAASPRALRRLDAETNLRAFAARHGASLTVLRAPGIYAEDRLPLERLKAGTPCLETGDDSWSNHIHADDLAAICVAALERQGGIRVYNACDDQPTAMGDWFDALADAYDLPRPARLPRDAVRQTVSPALWSFLAESRRLSNARLRRELKVELAWPSVHCWLAKRSANVEHDRDARLRLASHRAIR
ncbi:SDR family oxidoreductase [Crenobacter cavernae]|uniref:SDR family oxidoreductase n=1 Tax=Crenobacter cavernae TaxID=2290923 RepID=A0ABY0FC16_9NEIS|nr:SDR family oxidoreductase [Crenobacter cavernae]RXZ43619.1 SDR family oxidoreductase [Crenobacter cavernae]